MFKKYGCRYDLKFDTEGQIFKKWKYKGLFLDYQLYIRRDCDCFDIVTDRRCWLAPLSPRLESLNSRAERSPVLAGLNDIYCQLTAGNIMEVSFWDIVYPPPTQSRGFSRTW